MNYPYVKQMLKWLSWDNFFDIMLGLSNNCLLYTSDAADDLLCVDLGGRRNLKKKKTWLLYTSDAADEEDSVGVGGTTLVKRKDKRW